MCLRQGQIRTEGEREREGESGGGSGERDRKKVKGRENLLAHDLENMCKERESEKKERKEKKKREKQFPLIQPAQGLEDKLNAK